MRQHLIAFACSAALLALPALAQDVAAEANLQPAPASSWPTITPTNEVLVVTKAQPGKRHTCQLGSLTAEALTA